MLLEAVRAGHAQGAAAAIAGISRRTLHRELQRSAVLGRQVDQAKDEAEGRLLQKVIDSAAKNWVAAAWILERRFGYTRNFVAEVTAVSSEQAAMMANVDRLARMSPAELEAELGRNEKIIKLGDQDRARHDGRRLLDVTPHEDMA